jgi:hypothetical protein
MRTRPRRTRRRILEVAIALVEAETDEEYTRAYFRFRRLIRDYATRLIEKCARRSHCTGERIDVRIVEREVG